MECFTYATRAFATEGSRGIASSSWGKFGGWGGRRDILNEACESDKEESSAPLKEMSTLPPTPSYNANIPVLTSAGGTAAAYKDPNSPESLMKKTKALEVQATVDSTFDVAVSPYEGFKGTRSSSTKKKSIRSTLITFIIIILIVLFVYKALKFAAKVFLVVLAVILLVLLARFIQNESTPPQQDTTH
jgi:hypothetical protein